MKPDARSDWWLLTGALVVLAVASMLYAPVAAQQAMRMYGTFSGSPIAVTTDASGNLNVKVAGGTTTVGSLSFTNGTTLSDPSGSGKLLVAGTTPMIQLGGTTNAFPAIKQVGTRIDLRLADDSAMANLGVQSINPNGSGCGYNLNGVVLVNCTAPSNLSACGTSPSFLWTNGTFSFEIITGSAAPVATCTWTMPAQTNKWVCDATDITTQSTSQFYVKQTAAATNSVTMTNFNTAGAATAVVASDHLLVKCSGG